MKPKFQVANSEIHLILRFSPMRVSLRVVLGCVGDLLASCSGQPGSLCTRAVTLLLLTMITNGLASSHARASSRYVVQFLSTDISFPSWLVRHFFGHNWYICCVQGETWLRETHGAKRCVCGPKWSCDCSRQQGVYSLHLPANRQANC